MADPSPSMYLSVALEGWNGAVLLASRENAGQPIPADAGNQWRSWLTRLVNNDRPPDAKVLKTSKTVEVLDARLPFINTDQPLRVICKQTKARNSLLPGFRRSSAAKRNFQKALALQEADIATARPLAYLTHGHQGSWLITEFLEGVIDLDAYVLTVLSRNVETRSRRNMIIHSVANLFRDLERAALYHRDMKASNILLSHIGTSDKTPRVCIVDLDGLAKSRPWRSAWKPIVRLAASLLSYPSVTRTDYVRFLREYLNAKGQDRRAWRIHVPRLRKKAARYAQAAHNRKSDKLDGFAG